MTPIHRIAKNMAEDATLRKMTRTENAGWRKNIEAAQKRAAALKKGLSCQSV